jgi:poly-gamma-glutamate synthesis protein (capsule biosynthesis protein)
VVILRIATLVCLAAFAWPAAAQDFALTLTGDSIITMPATPHQANPRFRAVLDAVRDGQAAFTNLEMLFHNYEAPGAAQSGGTWMAADPARFKDLLWMGFNLFGTANNHSLDYGIEGLRIHRRHLQALGKGAAWAGTGEDLAEARAPAYLDTAAGKVALISCASTFPPSALAGAARAGVRGRPGLNPLRFRTWYQVERATLEHLRRMKADLRLRQEGDSDDYLYLLGATYEVADKPGVITAPHANDLQEITAAIRQARQQAAWVVVSIHAHEGAPGDRESPAQFLTTFAHAAIDAGADVFVGHGPHVLRGIEVYKGRPIFYSLGNFFFQNETVTRLPAEFYQQYGLGPEAQPADAFDARTGGGRRGWPADPPVWESVIARVAFRQGKPAEIRLTPVTLGFGRSRAKRGHPERADPAASASILERLQRLSQPFGTEISIEDGLGKIRIAE